MFHSPSKKCKKRERKNEKKEMIKSLFDTELKCFYNDDDESKKGLISANDRASKSKNPKSHVTKLIQASERERENDFLLHLEPMS